MMSPSFYRAMPDPLFILSKSAKIIARIRLEMIRILRQVDVSISKLFPTFRGSKRSAIPKDAADLSIFCTVDCK